MKKTTIVFALAGLLGFWPVAVAHHHTDDALPHLGAGDAVIFLAELPAEARAPARASVERRASRQAGRAGDEVDLSGKRVAVLIGEGFHDGETTIPAEFLEGLGAEVVLVGVQPARLTAYNSDLSLEIARTLSEVCVPDFDALIIPGGRSPANLREDRNVRRFVRAFVESGKPVAAICHGPQVLASAGVLSDRTVTGVGGIRGEMTDAGARFLDEAVVTDKNLITSRVPRDLPVFNETIAASLAAGP